MPVKTSNSFHEKPEGFSPERRNVFKKLRRLLKQFPKGLATPSRASGTREKIVRSMSRNRAVVGAELCGRWSRIVRSIGLNRAVVVRKADEETCQTVRPCAQRESTSVFDQYVTDKDEADPLSVGLGGEERAE